MKQSEKSQITKDKIIKSAIREFGTKNYDSASINVILSDSGVSKGLMYHNFKSKDELYLCCVKECFDRLTECVELTGYDGKDGQENLKRLFYERAKFFKENCELANIFMNVEQYPPEHLKKQLDEIRLRLDKFNLSFFRKILSCMNLRRGVTEEEAVQYFLMIQGMYQGYIRNNDITFGNEPVLKNEAIIEKMVNLILYGIVEEE